MDIVTYGLLPTLVRPSAASSVGVTPLPCLGHEGRYQISDTHLGTRGSLVVEWTDDCDGSFRGYVEVPLRPGRRTLHRGWKRLRIHGSRGCEDLVGAYLVPKTCKDGAAPTVVLYRHLPLADFMADIPDDTPLGDISLPGTHESCALYGYPISQCQQPSTPIAQQLLDGVRFLDVRLRVIGDELLMYHGPRPQRSSLPVLLSALHDFLSAHPTETLVMSIKEESPPFHPRFSALVYQAFRTYEDKFWFLEERVPRLGEVRGKGLLMTRFDLNEGDEGWPNGMGLHPYTWPDSRKEGFEWNCAGTTVRTQDWYRVKTFLSIPEKYDVLIDHLLPTLTASANPTFTLSFSSASYFPLSCPTTIAKGFGWPSWGLGIEGMNSRLTRWLLERVVQGEKVRACVPMDFYRQEGWPGELLVLMNFLGEGKENN